MNPYDFKTIKLVAGAGTPETGGCWMSALSVYGGERWSDHPDCVCPVIRELCIAINDSLPDDETRGRVIGPVLFDPLGTRTSDPTVMMERTRILVDAAVNVWGPIDPDAARSAQDAAIAITFGGDPMREDGPVEHAVAAADIVATESWLVAHASVVYPKGTAAGDAARERFIADHVLPVLLRMIAVGDKRPVERACSVEAFGRAVQTL